MVHALEEAWRVLRPGGALIDLRPVRSSPLLEILTDSGPESAGAIDDFGYLADQRACEAAIQEVISRGLYDQGEVSDFRFAYYWDSVEDLKTYADEKWTSSKIPEEVLARAMRLAGEAYGPVSVRVRRKLHLAIYSKNS